MLSFKSKIKKVIQFNKNFSQLLNHKSEYFSKSKLSILEKNITPFIKEINSLPQEKKILSIYLYFFQKKLYKKILFYKNIFFDHYNNREKKREQFNGFFIENEIKKYSQLFANIEEKELDEQQKRAVVTDENNNLVIAAAGSGKTLTIVGKINYLKEKYKISKNDILLISFTKKSAFDLEKRTELGAVTFHKLGLNIISEVEGVKPDIFNSDKLKTKLREFFTKEIQNKNYLNELLVYFMYHLKPYKSQFDFENQGDYIQHLRNYNFKPYFLPENKIATYNRETVKSIEECMIANYLLWNGLNYEYEKSYPFETLTKEHRQYRPDFTIIQYQDNLNEVISHQAIAKDYKKIRAKFKEFKKQRKTFNIENFKNFIDKDNNCENIKIVGKRDNTGGFIVGSKSANPVINLKKIKVFLEHFGIDRKKNVPRWFAKEGEPYEEVKKKYNETIDWKRKCHKKNKTILIETYSYEQQEGMFISNLEKKLKKEGFLFQRRPPEDVWELIKNNSQKDHDDFLELLRTFLNLMKGKNKTVEEIEKENQNKANKRNILFLKILKPIYKQYENHLKTQKQIDFNDMINKATYYVAQEKYKKKYKYIIVDEYQDISLGRYSLIRELQEKSGPFCKTFVVGDDWQSIYRFAGSDIGLFTDFQKYFGEAKKSKIETTYRYGEPLIDLSSKFIMNNPNQEKKAVKNFNNRNTNYVFYYADKHQSYNDTLNYIFDELLKDDNIKKKEIALLGRYNFDVENIVNKDNKDSFNPKLKKNKESIIYVSNEGKKLKVDFITAHKSKGLEYDIVVIINTKTGEYGFPSQIADDDVMNMILSQSDQYPHSEERRLFYVAMTRAKEKTIFLVDQNSKSHFIHEIESKNKKWGNKKCPKCGYQDLKKIKEWNHGIKSYRGLKCKNDLYGCQYYFQELLNDGVLIQKNKEFYFNTGKHQGKNIKNAPQNYLKWFLKQEDITDQTKKTLTNLLK